MTPCRRQVTSRRWITPIWRTPTSVQLNTQADARASANLYSLIETAKGHELEPYAYLRHIFKELPLTETFDDIDALLPGAIKSGDL